MSFRRIPHNTEGMVSLKVDNLTYRTTPEMLKRIFEKYGDVGDVYIPRDPYTKDSRGFAFVRYFDERDADDAIDRLDGTVVDGRELRVQLAKHARPPQSSSFSRRSGSYERSHRRSYSRSRSHSRSRGRRHKRSRSRSHNRSHRRSRRSYSRSRSRDHSHSRRRSRSHSQSPSRSRSRNHIGSKSPRRSHSHSERDGVADDKVRSRSSTPNQNGSQERDDGQSPTRDCNDSANGDRSPDFENEDHDEYDDYDQSQSPTN